jgi:hypothetical protein
MGMGNEIGENRLPREFTVCLWPFNIFPTSLSVELEEELKLQLIWRLGKRFFVLLSDYVIGLEEREEERSEIYQR